MSRFQHSTFRRTLPLATFEQLRSLLQQMAQTCEAEPPALLLTEVSLRALKPLQRQEQAGQAMDCFTVLVSPGFSALLSAQPVDEPGEGQRQEMPRYTCSLSFEPEAIAAFLTELRHHLPENAEALSLLESAQEQIRPNDPTLQSAFTLELVALLAAPDSSAPDDSAALTLAVCQPVENALRQQVEQEKLLNQVATQIRQSLELPVILQTAVDQVQRFLQSDRLLIYQFNLRRLSSIVPLSPEAAPAISPLSSYISYEARASDAIESVLNLSAEDCCFSDVQVCQGKYQNGSTLAIADVEIAYALAPCLLNLLRRYQVKAKLVAPIVVQEELWGLLIAHDCSGPRQWQEGETIFLQKTAEHLAIAIYQAQLYAQLQQQKQTLEQRVIERTQELHDALLAAQSASRAKSEFLATMSHELRTPLTCVIGMSSTLLRWSFGQLSQKQRHYLQTIHDSGEHLLDLINDILDLSQVEAGKALLNIDEFSLSKLALQSLQTLQEKANLNEIRLETEFQIEPQRDKFIADQRRVKQILLNLLSNAIKFTLPGGLVTLRLWTEGKTAVVQVEDTGIGIQEHQLPLLFQKFQQLDTSYHRKYEGTGLGLALTKQLVELHGGRIEVESTFGVGSSFTVYLPPQPLAAMSNECFPDAKPAPILSRIVLIEDKEETAMLICDLLTVAGYQVVWMVEGSTALKQIEILQPAVVITHMQLSSMDGYEIIRYLRNCPATQATKILALTTETSPEKISAYLAAGANDCLTKPIEPEQLLHKIMAFTATDPPNSSLAVS